MKNIIFIINQLRNSGPVRVLYSICKNLDRSKYNPIIFKLMDDDPTRSITHQFLAMDIEIREYHFNFYQLELMTSFIARRLRQDAMLYSNVVIHAHSYHPILLCSHIKDIPTIATVHSISGEDFVLTKGKLMGSYMCIRFHRALKNINHPVVISKYMRDYYKSKGSLESANVIYNGMDVDKTSAMISKDNFFNKYGLPAETKIILVAAWFSDRKNQEYIIRELLKSNRKDFVVLFAGKGELLEHCKTLANNDPRFIFLGFRSDVYELYKISDFYLSASKSEGMPLAVLEAINYGMPPILSSIPPHLELCDLVFGSRDYSFDYNQVDSLWLLFEKMMDCEWDHNKIQQLGEEKLSASAMTKKYCEIYDGI